MTKSMTQLIQWQMESLIGPLYLVASSEGLSGIYWQAKAIPMAQDLQHSSILAQAVKELEEYLIGSRQAFEVPLDKVGTHFQKAVWTQLQAIPYGQTLSYSEVARRIGNDKAVRAVGTANGRNPLSIIVPCHRVIAADGSLGGYAGGLAIKNRLLNLERKSLNPF